jgi:formylglycine-generating enzyme required for sulfatase activity
MDTIMHERLPSEPVMLHVPAGPFLMGTTDEQLRTMEERFDWFRNGTVIPIRDDRRRVNPSLDREQPARVVTLPAFEIGRFPVTNADLDLYYRETSRWPPWRWYEAGSPPRDGQPPCDGDPLARGGSLCGLAASANRAALSPAHGGRVGEGGPRRRRASLALGERLGLEPGQRPRGWFWKDHPGGALLTARR